MINLKLPSSQWFFKTPKPSYVVTYFLLLIEYNMSSTYRNTSCILNLLHGQFSATTFYINAFKYKEIYIVLIMARAC